MRYLLFALSAFAVLSCASKQHFVDSGSGPFPQEEYLKAYEQHTVKSDKYSGFYQTFQADITILSSDLQAIMLRQKAAYMQWDEKEIQTEREKTLQDATSTSRFFMRFFTPDRDYDDLHKGKTIWKVFLDFNGHRFEGKVHKMDDKDVNIKTLYPNYDHFSTPYEITFNVPMTRVEAGHSTVLLTSSLGSAEFKFPVAK